MRCFTVFTVLLVSVVIGNLALAQTLPVKAACQENPFCFIGSPFDANAQDFYIQGPVRYTVIKQSGNYLLSQFEGWARIARYGGVFQPQLLSFIPFNSYVPGANA